MKLKTPHLLLVLVGTLGQIFGYAQGIFSVVPETLAIPALVVLSYMTTCIVLIEALIATETTRPTLIAPTGEPYLPQIRRVLRTPSRVLLVLSLAIITTCLAVYLQRTWASLSRPAEVEEYDHTSYRVRTAINSLIRVSTLIEHGAENYETVDGLPLRITRMNLLPLILPRGKGLERSFGSRYYPNLNNHFTIEFEIRAVKNDMPVTIDGIYAVMDDYHPMPKLKPYERYYDVGAELAHAYYLQIEPPTSANKALFRAQINDDAGLNYLKYIVVKGGEADRIFLTINAKEPGVYGFAVEILIRSDDERQRFPLTKHLTVGFIEKPGERAFLESEFKKRLSENQP